MAHRKVHFFRANAGLAPSGALVPVNLQPALQYFDRLDFTPAGRYLDDGEGNALCVWPHPAGVHPSLALGVIRRSELPDLERGGALTPLRLPENSGIVEQSHFVFFPDNIVGMLFNFYGPRIGKLRWYLRQKYPGTQLSLRFDPLLRQDVLDQLDEVGEVRMLTLSVQRSFIARIEQADQGLGAGFRATADASDAELVEISMRPRPRRRQTLANSIVRAIKSLARAPEVQEEVRKFVVEAKHEDGALETIDVLKTRFIIEREVRVPRGRRAVDPQSAYAAIESAYGECRDELIRAAQIW